MCMFSQKWSTIYLKNTNVIIKKKLRITKDTSFACKTEHKLFPVSGNFSAYRLLHDAEFLIFLEGEIRDDMRSGHTKTEELCNNLLDAHYSPM